MAEAAAFSPPPVSDQQHIAGFGDKGGGCEQFDFRTIDG